MLALGGFLLFFTNFVAIVLTSDLVFFILGFRTTHLEEIQYPPRTRLLIIGTLLTLISIPLVYTLMSDLATVKQKKRIERVLRQHLNREMASRMTGYDVQDQDGKLLITAAVNTVKYIDLQTQNRMEGELTGVLKRPATLRLEQVIVTAGNVQQPGGDQRPLAGVPSPPPRVETPTQIRNRVEQLVMKGERELAEALAPFPVSDFRLSFSSGSEPVRGVLTVKRDYPVNDDEITLLSRILERSLGIPVSLSVGTVPLLPPLTVDAQGELTAASREALALIKNLPGGSAAYRFVLESPSKLGGTDDAVRKYLVTVMGVPGGVITTRHTRLPQNPNAVSLRILRR